MSATVSSSAAAATTPASTAGPSAAHRWARRDVLLALPTLLVAANAVAFVVLRPGVNDLWAARARAAAVEDGVGLTYWFSWFGGGTTPGTYSVLTPQLSALIGTELVCALAAVAVMVVGTVAVRGTRHPVAASWVLAYAAVANLWSGRVPFLLGGAIAIAALIALSHRRRLVAIVLTLVSILASPVSGAFIAMGLSGTFLTTRTREWRPIIAWVVGAALAAMLTVAIVFGSPGPEPFSTWLAAEVVGLLALMWIAAPVDHVRTTILWSVAATLVLWAIPNGMGSNFARFAWFCLPVVVIATTRLPLKATAVLLAPALIAGTMGTVTDLRNAVRPISSVGFYEPLARRLDRIGDLRNYRVEVVNHGAHAGYDALLDHAMLARGWETQGDTALNSSLRKDPLDPVTYKLWLDNNAVGYVAIPSASVNSYPEYDLVRDRLPDYLEPMWHTEDWDLYRVQDPTPIVAAPARVLGHTQSTLTLAVPCACTVHVRVRYSKFLEAALDPADAGGSGGTPAGTTTDATIADDGAEWTTMTTPTPGTYELTGSLRGFWR